MGRRRLTIFWLTAALAAGAVGGTTAAGHAIDAATGHIAVWHHRRALAKTVTLPPFTRGHRFADAVVAVEPVPESVRAPESRCYCYEVTDDRLAVVQTYYYAHQMLADYGALLKRLDLPPLKLVRIRLTKNPASPTTARLMRPHLVAVSYPTPAIDPFTLAQALGRLIDAAISPRRTAGVSATSAADAEAAGVAVGVANILAALELGQPGNLPFTDDTLDAPPANDVDAFVRFPDQVTTRRQALHRATRAPRFAARYGEVVALAQRRLADPAQRGELAAPDAAAASAAITQPLWQAAERFGFEPVKLLVLATVAGWAPPAPTYLALARALVDQAAGRAPRCAEFLRDEFGRRGLAVPKPRLALGRP